MNEKYVMPLKASADEPHPLPHDFEELIIGLGKYISSLSREGLPAVSPLTTMADLGLDEYPAVEEFIFFIEGRLGQDLPFSTKLSMTSWPHTTTLLDVAQSIQATLATPERRSGREKAKTLAPSQGNQSPGPT